MLWHNQTDGKVSRTNNFHKLVQATELQATQLGGGDLDDRECTGQDWGRQARFICQVGDEPEL